MAVMPETTATPYSILLGYERRALEHRAQASETVEGGVGTWRGLAFDVRGAEAVVAIGEITEILLPPSLTFVPGAKPWLRGIANLRGALLTVVDFGHFLLGTPTPHDDRNRVLVVRQRSTAATGLLVSAVLGQRSFSESEAFSPDLVTQPALLPYVPYAFEEKTGERYLPVVSLHALMRAQAFLDAAA